MAGCTNVAQSGSRWGLIFAFCLVFPGMAEAQTVLERILRQITISGLFVNAAQSGVSSHGARIDASITNILAAQTRNDAVIHAVAPVTASIGEIEAIALGASNAGEQVLGVSAQVSASDQQDIIVLPDVMGSTTVLLGGNTAAEYEISLARVDDLIALSAQTEYNYRQLGSEADGAVVALNMAANSGDVTARVLNHVEAVQLAAADITTTAIGSVNAGVSKIIGAR